jgi:putative tryptophan/tyrosine transport system substrate-binding protein
MRSIARGSTAPHQYGLVIIPDTFTLGNRDLLVNSTLQYRVPSIFPYRFYALSGGMISYGVDVADLFYRAASYPLLALSGHRKSAN